MKKQVLAVIAGVCAAHVLSVSAQTTIWFDDFESYADTAALSGPYTQMYPGTRCCWIRPKAISPINPSTSACRISTTRPGLFQHPRGSVTTDQNPLKVEFWTDLDTAIWSTRQYIEIRSYAGGEYGAGALNDLIALGFTSSGVDTTRINYRVVSGVNWGDLTDIYATRATIADPNNDWTKLAMVLYYDKVEFYVNDNLDTTQTKAAGLAFDSIVIGSGLSSAGADVWFDNLTVIVPEPSSLALSLLGGFGLLAMFRRRR